MTSRGDLDGRVAIITGGASGFGEATARLFVEEGARVLLADIQDDRGKALADEIGDAAGYHRCDVTSEDDVAGVVDAAMSAHGRLDVMFNNSPLFDLEPGAEAAGVKRLGWFDTDDPLRSGWAWGQERMQGGTALVEAELGDGRLFLFTPRITFRAQSHAAFPLLFNGIFYGSADDQPIF